jgi:putative glycosyltransferase (TIGR04348 family)
MIALHARRSYPAIVAYRRAHPHGPLIVALTGTDLYRDIYTSRHAQQSLEWADRLIVLQPCGRDELPPRLRSKVCVLFQSTSPTPHVAAKRSSTFDVCVLGHLRYEKDPFRAALALRLIPRALNVRVLHAGKALSETMALRARARMATDPRYHWLGEVSPPRARRLLARSRLLILSSRMEGGANVISEAIVDGVPVLASRISGSVGVLGARYPGFFPVGDTAALACLLKRAISDSSFYERLRRWCKDLKPLFDPARERNNWSNLLTGFAAAGQEK